MSFERVEKDLKSYQWLISNQEAWKLNDKALGRLFLQFYGFFWENGQIIPGKCAQCSELLQINFSWSISSKLSQSLSQFYLAPFYARLCLKCSILAEFILYRVVNTKFLYFCKSIYALFCVLKVVVKVKLLLQSFHYISTKIGHEFDIFVYFCFQ